jgi:hypothetical protein
MFNPTSAKGSLGHDAKAATAADATPGIDSSGYRGTLYVIVGGAQADTLTYTLQDSADNTNWTNVSAPVNGVAAQGVVVTALAGVAPVFIYVLHSAVRRYHRLLPASGAGDNFAAVAALRIDGDQVLTRNIDYIVGS